MTMFGVLNSIQCGYASGSLTHDRYCLALPDDIFKQMEIFCHDRRSVATFEQQRFAPFCLWQSGGVLKRMPRITRGKSLVIVSYLFFFSHRWQRKKLRQRRAETFHTPPGQSKTDQRSQFRRAQARGSSVKGSTNYPPTLDPHLLHFKEGKT